MLGTLYLIKNGVPLCENGVQIIYFIELMDRCNCPAPRRSGQTLEKNVLSWALAGTGSVLFIRQGAV